MKVTILVVLAVSIVGSWAEDCSTKIDAFHQCVEDSRKNAKDGEKAKWDALKPKVDACYTNNGCTPPVEAAEGEGSGGKGGRGGHGHGGHGGNSDCKSALRDAIRKNFEDCVKKAVPGLVIPQLDGRRDRETDREGGRGANHKEENKALENCKNKQAVRDCKRAIISSNKPTDAEKRARFQARCDVRAKCLTSLGATCQSQLEQFKKAACDCRQQQRGQKEQIRAGIKACQAQTAQTPSPSGSTRPPRDEKQKPCDQKDYCKLGYDAWVADHAKGHEKGGAVADRPRVQGTQDTQGAVAGRPQVQGTQGADADQDDVQNSSETSSGFDED